MCCVFGEVCLWVVGYVQITQEEGRDGISHRDGIQVVDDVWLDFVKNNFKLQKKKGISSSRSHFH